MYLSRCQKAIFIHTLTELSVSSFYSIYTEEISYWESKNVYKLKSHRLSALCGFYRFQSCHAVAVQALHALRMRAEYELLTNAIQVSMLDLFSIAWTLDWVEVC